MSKFKVFNGFGIKPTKSYEAAGWDFYVPAISNPDETTEDRFIEAVKKSYGKTDKQITTIMGRMENEMRLFGHDELYQKWKYTMLLLFLSVDGAIMRSSQNKVATFISYYLVWSEDERPGISLHCNDHIFLNSGIKVILDKHTAGVFANKSGRGNKGWDIRACVVDEDYSGYVHLSLAYTKDNADDGKIYAGDKLTQMLILNIVPKDCCEEVDENEYMKHFVNSERGDNGFGSTDKN